MANGWIETIGIELDGSWEHRDGLTVYHMSEKELAMEKTGTLAVVGTTTYIYGPKGSYKEHNYTICNMLEAISIDIFYDVEDNNMMDQTIKFANGKSVYGRSRNYEEVGKWKKLGIPITESYGY